MQYPKPCPSTAPTCRNDRQILGAAGAYPSSVRSDGLRPSHCLCIGRMTSRHRGAPCRPPVRVAARRLRTLWKQAATANDALILRSPPERASRRMAANRLPIPALVTRVNAVPRRMAPELYSHSTLHESKRAQGMPGEGPTHGPPATRKAGGSHHRFSRTSGIPCAAVLTLISCSSRCTGLVGHRRHRDHHPSSLASASGCQNHTTSRPPPARSSSHHPRPPHPRPTYRDDRPKRPSSSRRDARDDRCDLPDKARLYGCDIVTRRANCG
jgi:hypothetical protein